MITGQLDVVFGNALLMSAGLTGKFAVRIRHARHTGPGSCSCLAETLSAHGADVPGSRGR